MVHNIMKHHKRVCTWYIHGMYIQGYQNVCTSFRRAYTCIYMYIHVLSHTNMYIQCTNMYMQFVSMMFRVQMATYIS